MQKEHDIKNPPQMAFEYTVFDRPLDKPGGALPPLPEHKDVAPQFNAANISLDTATIAPDKSPDWVSAWLAAHWPDLQGMTGECVHCVAVHLVLATALHIQGVTLVHPSVGFSYYTTTGDASFRNGSWLSAALPQWQSIGNCTDELYSQDWVISHWQGGGDYPPEFLPQPSAYADAPKRKIIRWSQVSWTNPDINQLKLLINAGYSIGFQIGNHEITIDMYDGWWFWGFDSEMNVDQTTKGVGVRAFSTDLVLSGFGFCIVEEVDVTGGAGLGTLIMPNNIDFGNVPVNTTVRKTGILRNETTGPVSYVINIANPAFIGSGNGIMSAGVQVQIPIDFKPTIAGVISTQAIVTSNTPGSPQHFGLTGVGVGSSPPIGQQMEIDNCKIKSSLVKTDADGLVINQITQAILDKGRADASAALTSWNALVVDAGGPPGLAVTTTTLTVTPSPANANANLALRATVTGASPFGFVNFKQGTTQIGRVNVSQGVATFTLIGGFPAGSYNLTANFEGDTNNAPSSSIIVPLTVTGSTSVITYMPPATTLTDNKGLVWTQGDFVSTRWGWQLRCNMRGLASSPKVALVGGEIIMQLEDGKNSWQKFVGNDAYDNRWVATAAPT